jgi:transcriptional regulator with XRE-family HTH domain
MEEARRPNQRLRCARLQRGWSQQRVADLLNQLPGATRADRELVYRWEAGKRTPSPFYRERLCQVFNMSAGQLGLVELPVVDLADAARTVTGGWGRPAGGSGDGLLPEAVDVLMRELWGDQVNRRAMLQVLGAIAAGTAVEGASLQRTPVVPVAHANEVVDHSRGRSRS